MNFDLGTWASLAVALGLGLVIGVERERNKGSGPTRRFAGIRTFSLVALTGAGVQLLEQDWLSAIAATAVAGLIIVSHMKDRSGDPGVTTEVALMLTFVLGMLAVPRPALAAALGVVVAGLLAARTPLQYFSTRLLAPQELRDALILAASALIILPLAPKQALAWLGGINPHSLWLLVVVIMAVQALGHVALRVAGARLGLSLSGLLAGFVSSTVTVAVMGTRAARRPEQLRACIAAAWLSTVATAAQMMLIALAIDLSALRVLLPVMGAALGVALALGLAAMFWGNHGAGSYETQGRAFSVWHAVGWAVLLGALTMVVRWIQEAFGVEATYAASTLAGFADAHATAAAVASLFQQGAIAESTLVLAVLLAFSSNSVSKCVAAFVAGGMRYGLAVSVGLLLIALAAWSPWAWQRWLA